MEHKKRTDRIWVSPDPQKNVKEKTRLFYGKWGGGGSPKSNP